MNKYLLRFIKECKTSSIVEDVNFKIKKQVSKVGNKYLGTIYKIKDTKNKIRIYVTSEPQDKSNHCVFMEREDCFDKLSTCPVQLPIPKNEEEYAALKTNIVWLIADATWYAISNEYQTEKWIKEY